ncbi:MAG TPA: IS481 family transposase, partial [Candidatus Dormibacteraeota bacterium]
APTQALLQLQLDTFPGYYNDRRPHRALAGRTLLTAFHARQNARPEGLGAAVHHRVRHDRVDQQRRVSLRCLSRLRHICLGRAYAGVPVRLLVANKQVRVIREDGSLLRELVLDPAHDYQPLGAPSGRPRVAHDDVRHVSAMS